MTKGLKGAAVAAFASLAVAAPAAAKTYEVNKRSDHAPNGCKKKDCTLREAVLAANARGGSDRILLPQRKTYNLAIENTDPTLGEEDGEEGDLDVTSPLRLVHPGKGAAKVDANGVDRVFDVFAGAPTSFKRIVITGGDAASDTNIPEIEDGGGGIRSTADLVLRRSKVTSNSNSVDYGGGINLDQGAGLTLVRSSVSRNSSDDDGGAIDSDDGPMRFNRAKLIDNTADGNGGAIYFFSRDSRFVKSTISGNSAGSSGGGIHDSGGELRLIDSTFSFNTTENSGGGANLGNDAGDWVITGSTFSRNSAVDQGGGISVANDGRLSISNSTVASNSTGFEGGGIANPDGDVQANAVTIVRNTADSAGGGITYGTAAPGFEIQNSLVALNSAPFAPDCFADPLDPFDSGGHNLIGDDSDCAGFDATGDFVNSNPKLGLLKNNGGPTQTVALKKRSPAINKAAKSAPNKDQRGVKRGKKPDIGAYERVKKKKK